MTQSSRVRVAFCITELDVGGAERSMVQLVKGLNRDEWEPRVYCLASWGSLVAALQETDVPVQCLDAVHLWDVPRIVTRLRRELKTFRPAILQSFLFHANIVGRLSAAYTGGPRVVSGVRVAERRSRIYGWIDRSTNFLVDRNVCVSRGVADFCEQDVGLPPRKTVIIPNGVDVSRYRHAEPIDWSTLGVPSHARVLLTVARLEPQKGVDLLIPAVVPVLKAIPETHLVIVGDGADRGMLQSLVAASQMESRIHFAGRRSDVPRLMAAAELFVLASRWEGMPNAVLEAMAAAKPIVATAVEGTSELLTSGESGWLVPPGNLTDLTTALMECLQQPAAALTLGKWAQAACEKQFTIEAMVAKYVQLYRQLLAEHPSRTL